MGKQDKNWTPPADAEWIGPPEDVQSTPDPKQKTTGWTPPEDAIPVEVKKKEPTESVPASEGGTTTPVSSDGSTPSTSGTPPTEKPFRTVLSEQEEQKFQEWRLKLPVNLQADSDDYDLRGAFKAGLEPENGHLPSRDPKTGLILKSQKHPTFQKTLDGEKAAGFEVYEKQGRMYSRPLKARGKLKTRVQNLSAMYQGKFVDELKPFLDEQQKQYAGAVTSKQTELQSLVDSGKLNVDQANSQLQEFSTTKKAEFDQKIKAEQEVASVKFDQKYGKEISKWLNLYNEQYAQEDFDENKITNPLKSFGKSAWTTFTMDLPSAAYAARALGRSAYNKMDNKLKEVVQGSGILPEVDPAAAEQVFFKAMKFITGATDEQLASAPKSTLTMDAVNKKMIIDDLTAATELSNASAEAKRYLINNLDKVKSGDWLDIMNYVASAAGTGAGQIPVSIGTRGTTSIIQEMGSIYLDSVHKIAQESGLSVEEVIKQGKDDVVFPLLFGFGAGLLDAYGANRIAKAFGKDQVMNSFRQRAIEVAKTTGYESLTEGAQGVLEEIGVKKSAGKSWIETLKSINPDVIMESALQGGIAGMFLGGSAQTVQAGIRAMTPSVKPKITQEEAKVSPIDAAVQRGATVSLQADKPTKTVIEEAKIAVDPKNPESVAAAAETIQQSFNEKQDATETTEPANVTQPIQISNQEPGAELGEVADQSSATSVPVDVSGTPVTSGQTDQTTITDEKGTYDFSGVRERLSKSEEAGIENLREQILNSPEDLKWNGKKVSILTEKGAEMLRQYQELKQQNPEAKAGETSNTQTDGKVKTEGRQDQVRLQQVEPNQPTTNEQNTTTAELVAQPPDQSQQEPVGSGQGGTVVSNDIPTPATEVPPQDQANTTESPAARQDASAEQSTQQPVADVQKTSEGDAGSYTFRRPVMPPPGSPMEERSNGGTEGVRSTYDGGEGAATDAGGGTTPPIQPPISNQPSGRRGPVSGERATIVKLQEQSTLHDDLKEGIEDFKEYETKKQSKSRERAQKYIKRHGEDQALQDAISFKFARPQEEKMALLSELANKFSAKFKRAEQNGDQAKVDEYYSKFMTAMNTLSNFITDTAQALSYLNLVGTIFETKTGAVRFAKNQIEQSREGAMKNYQEVKMTAEDILKAFDALPREEFLKSKQVQDILAKVKKESPKATRVRQANDKLSSAAEKLKAAWDKNKTVGIIFDPKSQAQKDVELTNAIVDYIKALIEKIAAESGEFIRNISDQVTKGTKEFIGEVGIEIEDNALAELIKPQVEEFQRSTRYTQPITPAERNRAVSLIRGLLLPTDAKSGTVVKPQKPAIAEFYDRLINRVLTTDAKKPTPQNRADAIEEVLKNIDKYTDVLKGVRDELQAEGIDTSDIDAVFQLPFFEKALRKNQDVLDAQKLVDDHYSNVERVKNDLANKFQDQYGLDQKTAIDLEIALDKVFDEWMAKEKQKVVNRFKPKTRKPDQRRTEFYDKVIKLSNVGAVTDQQLEDTIAQIFGLPKMTPEIVSKIESMVEEINAAPEGRFKNIAITKMTDYIATQQKFNVSDYLLASFRAGIFSGVDTQALNLLGNFFNIMEMGFMMSMSNPMAGSRFIGSIRNPTSIARAGLEALEVLKTGFDPRVAGDMRRRVLEQGGRSFMGIGKPLEGWKQALDPTLEQQKKYVFRALSAGDILFSQGINDALQNEMYARRAKEMGLKGKEAAAYVREQMGFTPEKIQKALDQASNEALGGQIPNNDTSISLRSKEIIEQQRDPQIIEKSREYAQAQILTNTPTGYIGVIARGINSMIQSLPVISAVIPVVNFAANAMQRAVQYVPPAALARGTAKYLSRMVQGENLSTIIKDDLQRLKSGDLEQEMRLRRFAAGTVSLAILAVMLDEDDDGDNLLSRAAGKTIKIHGSGPGTKLNRQKTYQKQETGYVPYSIQIGDTYIPYKNYPGMNVLLSTFGEYEDAKRYGKLDKKDALNRLVFAVCNSFSVISEMGFLTSLNTTTQAFLEANPKEFTSLIMRPLGSFLVPKFQRNLLNFFDNNVYSGRDVQEITIRSIPILNTAAGDPLVNALGEEVQRNWWDRVELWNTESYSQYKPIWNANAEKNYYFTVPPKASLENTFERQISTEEYNKFFKLRGEEIVKEFKSEFAQLPPEEYSRKMDKVVDIAKYRALVKMGVMETDLMKEIRFQLDDIMEVKRQSQQLKKDIK